MLSSLGGDPKNIWDPFCLGWGGSPFRDTPNSLLGGRSDPPPHFWGALGWGRPPPNPLWGHPQILIYGGGTVRGGDLKFWGENPKFGGWAKVWGEKGRFGV